MILFLAGCAWIGSQQHQDNLDRWSIQIEAVDGTLDNCSPTLEVRGMLSSQRAGESVSLEVQLDGQTRTDEAVVATDGSVRWTPEPFDEVTAGEQTYQLVVGATTIPWTSTFPSTTRYIDADEDGFGDAPTTSCDPGQPVSDRDGDCDDDDAARNPDTVWYVDADHDGFGDDTQPTEVGCEQPNGYTLVPGDCNDALQQVLGPLTWAPDEDGDGLGSNDPQTWEVACVRPTPTAVEDTSDCDDSDAAVLDFAYVDDDGDGYGTGPPLAACPAPGLAAVGLDCDDSDPHVSPAADELCTPDVDENCDLDPIAGAVDTSTWYADSDGDGFGDAATSIEACAAPTSYVGNDGDCEDGNGAVSPDGTEVCDGLDNDCANGVDDGQGGYAVGSSQFTDLGQALDAASDTVPLIVCEPSSTWPGPDVLNGRQLTLRSARQSTISGSLRVVNGNLTFEGLTLEGGPGTTDGLGPVQGGVMYGFHSDVVFVDSVLTCEIDATVEDGGALMFFEGSLTLEGTQISGCSASTGGAIQLESAELVVRGAPSELFDNTATWGGAIAALSPDGSGVTLAIEDDSLIVRDNTASNAGGGAYLEHVSGTIAGTWTGNEATANGGGALHIDETTNLLTIRGTYDENHAGGSGGAMIIGSDADVRIESELLRANEATYGGAVYLRTSSSATIVGGRFELNQASLAGGAVGSLAEALSIEAATFVDNQAGDPLTYTDENRGGALSVYTDHPLDLRDTDFTGNQAHRGGAIFIAPGGNASPTLDLDGVTFQGNTAEVDAGAVWAAGTSVTLANEVQFTGNEATTGGGGGLLLTAADDLGVLSSNQSCGSLTGDAQLMVVDNSAATDGGGLAAVTPLQIEDGSCLIDLPGTSVFEGNEAGGTGAAIDLHGYYLSHTESSAIFGELELYENTAGASAGGAVRLNDGTFACVTCTKDALRPNAQHLLSITSDAATGTYDGPGASTFAYLCEGDITTPNGACTTNYSP